MAARVSIDDLNAALFWLEAAENSDDAAAVKRVQAWIDAEIKRRQQQAVVRAVSKDTGRAPAEVRAALHRRIAGAA